MRHAVDHRKLRRNPSHRKALLKNLMNALVSSERIETTVAKAMELRRLADTQVVEGRSSAEIGEILGCSEGAVEQKLVRARTALRTRRDPT